MSNYHRNKLAAVFINTEPTMTDQASARETDINVIVGKMIRTGQVNGTAQQPIYADFSGLPADYRAMLESVRNIDRLHNDLPEQLRKLTLDELAALTPEQAANILNPPPAPPAKDEETK